MVFTQVQRQHCTPLQFMLVCIKRLARMLAKSTSFCQRIFQEILLFLFFIASF
ncbi:hypothetical protein U27_02176 [Candidatus Vecturithrix granuli]|uniref:Uncharacterized protein n=1 Tax=Vecturithrix granuli TaxID=1499967 RepID=A0A0S6W6Q8_VECG1|nr:hypothetical protein U27_02176 [Candidatus Vecturithrix granuli]